MKVFMVGPFAMMHDSRMKIVRIEDVEHPGSDGLLARPLLEGEQSNVRIIRLAAGHALPPHRHGRSDVMLYVVDGQGAIDSPTGSVSFEAGALASYGGDEELRVSNTGVSEMTMLAFLAPKFATS
jgi:quercetin dioxygenase-like cupin family protein